MNVTDLFPIADMQKAMDDGLVVHRSDPTNTLGILNYTARCQYERGNWNVVTLNCRGLIFNVYGEVVARPFRKFFNYGDPLTGMLDPSAPAVVTDKMDGSLGILYPHPAGGYAIATRGSFDGEQAIHATAVWRERYAGRFTPLEGYTYLFEIVYPKNRIVVDYGDTDDLYLLGAIEIETGINHLPDTLPWPGQRVAMFEYHTLAEALAAPPRPNAEGLVIFFPGTGERVKLKQDDYLALHRIVTGLNERTVWEHLAAGKPLLDLLNPLPAEFHAWVMETAWGLRDKVLERAGEVVLHFDHIKSALPEGASRKDFALRALAFPQPIQGCLFAKLDGKDYLPILWKSVRPEAGRGPREFSEATA